MAGFYTAEEVFQMVRNGEKIENTILSEIDLSNLDMRGAKLENISFDRVNINKCHFNDSFFTNTIFNIVRMEGIGFKNANLNGSIIINSNCNSADFTNADLSETMFFIENAAEKNPEKVDINLEDLQLSPYELKTFKEMEIVGFSKKNLTHFKRKIF